MQVDMRNRHRFDSAASQPCASQGRFFRRRDPAERRRPASAEDSIQLGNFQPQKRCRLSQRRLGQVVDRIKRQRSGCVVHGRLRSVWTWSWMF